MREKDLNHYRLLPYSRKTVPVYDAEEKLSYWEAKVVELEGCVAHGHDRLEALANLSKAFNTYIRGMHHFGREAEIPLPLKTPVTPRRNATPVGALSAFARSVNVTSGSEPVQTLPPFERDPSPFAGIADDTPIVHFVCS